MNTPRRSQSSIFQRTERSQAMPSRQPAEVIVLDDDDHEEENGDDSDGSRSVSPETMQIIETLDFPDGHDIIDSAENHLGETLEANDTVECDNGQAFLRIVFVTRDAAGRVFLTGTRLVRNGAVNRKMSMNGHEIYSYLPRGKNEVCAMLTIKAGTSATFESSFVTRSLTGIGKKRVLVFTNHIFDKHTSGWRSDGVNYNGDTALIEATAQLTCRWKFVEEVDVRNKKVVSYQLRQLGWDECDLGNAIAEVLKFRAFCESRSSQPGLSASNGTASRAHRTPQRLRTYGDICAGGGGMARGAALAGLDAKFLLDNNEDACDSLRLNFGNDSVREMDFRDLNTVDAVDDLRVDILHVSFECKPFSFLNRGQNEERDSERIWANLAFEDILARCKPKIVTLEQVNAVTQRYDGQYFRAQVQALTTAGYSLRWGKRNLAEHGVAQARPRLIVIASCAGHLLPDWPAATHGPGLKPWVTVQDALAQIPRAPQGLMAHSIRRDLPSYNPATQLRGCITSSGGTGNLHPSGRRTFNLRELAVLQSFPPDHEFFGGVSSIREQIGNAVPPIFAKALFENIIKCMEAMDMSVERYRPTVIELD